MADQSRPTSNPRHSCRRGHITRLGTLHRQPLCWHSVSSNKGAKPYQRLPSATSNSRGFRDRVHDSGMLSTIPRNPEKWTSSRRNLWTPSIGMGGQHRLEWVVKMARNTHAGGPIPPLCRPRQPVGPASFVKNAPDFPAGAHCRDTGWSTTGEPPVIHGRDGVTLRTMEHYPRRICA